VFKDLLEPKGLKVTKALPDQEHKDLKVKQGLKESRVLQELEAGLEMFSLLLRERRLLSGIKSMSVMPTISGIRLRLMMTLRLMFTLYVSSRAVSQQMRRGSSPVQGICQDFRVLILEQLTS